MRVTVDGTTYLVRFKHEAPKLYDAYGGKISRSKRQPGKTTCSVYEVPAEGKENILVSEETAVCSFSDQFKKETGRKRSLSMVLRGLFPFRPGARMQFWDTYFARFPEPKDLVKVTDVITTAGAGGSGSSA